MASIREPELVQINEIVLKNFDFTGLALSLNADIHNPNNFRIHINTLDAELFIEDQKLGNLSVDTTVTLHKNTITRVELSLVAGLKELSGQITPITNLFKKRNQEVKVRMNGTLTAQAKGMIRKITFDRTQSLKL